MSPAKSLEQRELSAVLPQFELLLTSSGSTLDHQMELGMGTSVGRILRFGSFEANMRAGELRKRGIKVRLQDQPFQILVMLLGRPGELVTRQEIHQKLWPADTFVDFDHGLNNAINRLREAWRLRRDATVHRDSTEKGLSLHRSGLRGRAAG